MPRSGSSAHAAGGADLRFCRCGPAWPVSEAADQGFGGGVDQGVHGGGAGLVGLQDEAVDTGLGVPAGGVQVDRLRWGDADLERSEAGRAILRRGGLLQGGDGVERLLDVALVAE